LYNINGKSLFRLNTEVLVEFGDGSAISIRKILHQLAFLQQEDAGGDVGNEVEVVAGTWVSIVLSLSTFRKAFSLLSHLRSYISCIPST
jgi:hypothetical protein